MVTGAGSSQDGRLQSGDHILRIGEHNLRGMESVQVRTQLAGCGSAHRDMSACRMSTNPFFDVKRSYDSFFAFDVALIILMSSFSSSKRLEIYQFRFSWESSDYQPSLTNFV